MHILFYNIYVHFNKYLCATLKKDGSSEGEIRIRIATATSAIVRLDKIWKSKKMNFTLKHNLYKSLVLSIFLYGCESWTMLDSMEKKIVALENKSHKRLLGITNRQKITNVIVKKKIVSLVGNYVPLLAIVMKRKLCWFGHITRHNSLVKTILQGKIDGKRSQG